MSIEASAETISRLKAELLESEEARQKVESLLTALEYGEVDGLMTDAGLTYLVPECEKSEEANRMMHGIVSAMAIAVVVIDERGIIQHFNPAAEDIFGYTVAETIDQNVSMLMPAAEARKHDGYLRNYLQTGEGRVLETSREIYAKRKNNRTFRARLFVTEMQIDNHVMFVGSILDTEAQKIYETKFHALFEGAGDAIFVTDAETGLFIEVNSEACNRLGYTQDDLLGMGLEDISDSSGGRIADVFSILLDKGFHTFQHEHRTKDGQYIPVEITATKVTLDGRIVFLSTVRDVSIRERAKRERDAARELATNVMRSLPAHVVVLNQRGNIIMSNEAWRSFGLNNGANTDGIGFWSQVSYFDVCKRAAARGDTDAGAVLEGLQEILSGRSPSFSLTYPCHDPDGTQRYFMLHAVPLRGLKKGLVVSHTNVTDRVLAEEAQRTSEEKANQAHITAQAAEEARQLTETFIASVSHETRTPVHHILSFLDLALHALSEQKTNDAADRLRSAQDAAHRMLDLLNDILNLAKIQAGQMNFELTEIDLITVIKKALAAERGRAEEQGITLTCSPTDSSLPTVCDARQISQVITNILGNAVKFTTSGGVSIKCAAQEEHIHISVIDTGPGIVDADLQRIFDPFYQSEVGRAKPGGTGLGLAICRELITAHHGQIWAEHNHPHGAIFHIVLPRRMEHEPY